MTTPTASDRERARCCGTSVGAIIRRWVAGQWEYLLIERAWWPLGWAPIAGHVKDEHDTPWDAVHTEVPEESNLTVASARLVLDALPLGNLCASPPSTLHGHRWWIYLVEATGALNPNPNEALNARWIPETELAQMAQTTIDHAHAGGCARDLPTDALEGVWVELFAQLAQTTDAQPITPTVEDRVAVARLYSTPPDTEWVPVA